MRVAHIPGKAVGPRQVNVPKCIHDATTGQTPINSLFTNTFEFFVVCFHV